MFRPSRRLWLFDLGIYGMRLCIATDSPKILFDGCALACFMTITDYSFVRDAFNHRSPYQKSDKYCLADIRKRNELILSTVKRLHHSLLPTTSSPPSCANRFLQSLVAAIRSVTHDLRSRIGARPSCSRPKPKPWFPGPRCGSRRA